MFSFRFIVATINEVGAVNALYRNAWVDCEGGMRLTWGTCVLAAGISTWESTKCKFCSCDCRLLVGACVERSRIRQILDIAERAALRMVWILWDNHVPKWFKTKSSCTWFSCVVSLIMTHPMSHVHSDRPLSQKSCRQSLIRLTECTVSQQSKCHIAKWRHVIKMDIDRELMWCARTPSSLSSTLEVFPHVDSKLTLSPQSNNLY